MKTKYSKFGIIGFASGFILGSILFNYLKCDSIWNAIFSIILGIISNKATNYIDKVNSNKNNYLMTSNSGGSIELQGRIKATSKNLDAVYSINKSIKE